MSILPAICQYEVEAEVYVREPLIWISFISCLRSRRCRVSSASHREMRRRCSNQINIATLNSLLISLPFPLFVSINFRRFSLAFFSCWISMDFVIRFKIKLQFLYRRFCFDAEKVCRRWNTSEYLMWVRWLIHKNGKRNGNAYNYAHTHAH